MESLHPGSAGGTDGLKPAHPHTPQQHHRAIIRPLNNIASVINCLGAGYTPSHSAVFAYPPFSRLRCWARMLGERLGPGAL